MQVFANVGIGGIGGIGVPLLIAAYERACPGTFAGPFGLRLREALGLGAAAPEAASGAAPAAHPEPLAPARAPLPPGVEALSERELEVLRTVAEGLSNAEAGRRLFLSPFTVKKHLEHVYGKLGARNRTEAIARARGLGLF